LLKQTFLLDIPTSYYSDKLMPHKRSSNHMGHWLHVNLPHQFIKTCWPIDQVKWNGKTIQDRKKLFNFIHYVVTCFVSNFKTCLLRVKSHSMEPWHFTLSSITRLLNIHCTKVTSMWTLSIWHAHLSLPYNCIHGCGHVNYPNTWLDDHISKHLKTYFDLKKCNW
jgi:hypothetical protein